MSWNLGVIAIKTVQSDIVLDLTNEYYKQYGLSLVEERVGSRNGKYARSPKHYNDLKEYDESEIKPLYLSNYEFTTNFDFFDNLEENTGWSMFWYNQRLADYTLNINQPFAQYLSKQMNTTVIEYFEYEVGGMKTIRGHQYGELRDEYSIVDGEIDELSGYFEKLREYNTKDFSDVQMDEMQSYIDDYLTNNGLILYSDEFSESNIKSRRPMYLKGSPDNILNFLKYKQIDS